MTRRIGFRFTIAIALAAAGLAVLVYGITVPSHVTPPRPQPSRANAQALATAAAGASTIEVAKSPPAHISIPSISVTSTLGPARGLNANGTINDAPLSGPTWSLPWWYDKGPTPGQDGSSVILGHVDSALGAGNLGVFFRLGDVKPGDPIDVTLADGSVTRWVAVTNVLYSDSDFPDSTVYAKAGPPELRLVTCGGTYNYTTHLYESADVVTARLVGVSDTSS